MTVKKTSDYSIFKKHDGNAPLEEKNVIKIMKSIDARNMLEFRPILCDSEMRVLDGQHRIEAAKRLKLPVFYEVDQNAIASDMILLNNACRKWRLDYYLNFHVNENNNNYILFKNFIERNETTAASGLLLLFPGSRKIRSDFREGKMKFPEGNDYNDAISNLKQVKAISKYCFEKCEGTLQQRGYLKGANFLRAITTFLCNKSVDFDVFYKKLPYNLHLIRPCSRWEGHLHILKSIYNWKNSNKIQLSEDEIEEQRMAMA